MTAFTKPVFVSFNPYLMFLSPVDETNYPTTQCLKITIYLNHDFVDEEFGVLC